MRTVYVQACIRFPLGKQGENEAVRVVWPGIVEKFRKLYGSGAFTLTAKRCGDAEAYPVAVSTEGGDVVWLVRAEMALMRMMVRIMEMAEMAEAEALAHGRLHLLARRLPPLSCSLRFLTRRMSMLRR